jgi:DNA-binding response OmpR family regulator
VFTNLIDNALEAVPADGEVRVRVESNGGEHVRVVVENSGAGIPAEIQERIFHPFFTTKPRGTGLGLPIARQIIEAHHGRLHVEREGASATVFVVGCPPRPPSGRRSTPMSERIIITEDDEDLAFVIREALTRQGYEAEVAPTAVALLDKLKAGSYDLILLDVRLPDMDGLDAIPRCRDLAPETPIIVMTAHGTRQIAMNAITRGAYDFFTKPSRCRVQVVVSRALDRRRLQQQVKVLREGRWRAALRSSSARARPQAGHGHGQSRRAHRPTVLIHGRAARARSSWLAPSTG